MSCENKLKGTKTEANLWEAFGGESMARNKYTFFASTAKKEGYVGIASIFEETAGNEKEHAEIWFKKLNGIGDTAANLKEAANGEHYEWTEMYPRMAKEAREEGFNDIAILFEMVAAIENHHDERYESLLQALESDSVFTDKEEVFWICTNCGHVHRGIKAPQLCPVCAHAQAYFVRK